MVSKKQTQGDMERLTRTMNSDVLVRIEENSYRKKPDKQIKKKHSRQKKKWQKGTEIAKVRMNSRFGE